MLVSINVCNDIMKKYTIENGGDNSDYLSLQSKFEVMRGIVQARPRTQYQPDRLLAF